MLILPAIDLRGGRVVRLLHGRFDAETDYGDDPVAQARDFLAAGAKWLHVVDLDGAKDGAMRQISTIREIAGVALVQAGGGVRTWGDVERLIDAGVGRVVLGSLAVAEPLTITHWARQIGKARITVALDVAAAGPEPVVLARGWQDRSGVILWDALEMLGDTIRHLLVTDISRDGAMTGPNLGLMRQIIERRPDLELQASGGVRDVSDIGALKRIGVAAVIVGRALYENSLTLEEALAC